MSTLRPLQESEATAVAQSQVIPAYLDKLPTEEIYKKLSILPWESYMALENSPSLKGRLHTDLKTLDDKARYQKFIRGGVVKIISKLSKEFTAHLLSIQVKYKLGIEVSNNIKRLNEKIEAMLEPILSDKINPIIKQMVEDSGLPLEKLLVIYQLFLDPDHNQAHKEFQVFRQKKTTMLSVMVFGKMQEELSKELQELPSQKVSLFNLIKAEEKQNKEFRAKMAKNPLDRDREQLIGKLVEINLHVRAELMSHYYVDGTPQYRTLSIQTKKNIVRKLKTQIMPKVLPSIIPNLRSAFEQSSFSEEAMFQMANPWKDQKTADALLAFLNLENKIKIAIDAKVRKIMKELHPCLDTAGFLIAMKDAAKKGSDSQDYLSDSEDGDCRHLLSDDDLDRVDQYPDYQVQQGSLEKEFKEKHTGLRYRETSSYETRRPSPISSNSQNIGDTQSIDDGSYSVSEIIKGIGLAAIFLGGLYFMK